MILFCKHTFFVIHALTVIVLSLLPGNLEPWIPGSFSDSVLITVIVIAVSVSCAFLFSKLKHVKLFLYDYIDLMVFLSVWTGVNTLAFKTAYPPESIRNFPNLTRFFPFLFVLGIVVLILLSIHKNRNTLTMAWLVMFMAFSLPYTRPMDHHTLAMSFPVMTVVYAIHREFRSVCNLFAHPNIFLLFTSGFVVLAFHTIASLYSDFDLVVPDMLFFSAVYLAFLLSFTAVLKSRAFMLKMFKKCTSIHLLIVIVLAILWITRTTLTWGVMSILTYRLWISLLHPNALAAYLLTAFIIMVPLRKSTEHYRFYLTVSILSCLLFLLTQSRGMLAASALSLLPVLGKNRLIYAFRKHLKQKWIVMTGVMAVAVTAVVLSRVHYRLVSPDMIQDRVSILQVFLRGIARKPFSGFGYGSKPLLASFVTDPFAQNIEFIRLWMNWDRLGQHFHNLYVEIYWLFGIPGILVFAGLMYQAFKNSARHTRFRIATTALLLFGLSDCPFYYPAVLFTTVTLVSFLVISETRMRISIAPGARKLVQGFVLTTAVFFLFTGPINSFYHRFVYALGVSHSASDPDKAEQLLSTAAFGLPRSVKAAGALTAFKMREGKCLDAVSFLDSFSGKMHNPAIPLLRLRAWLERNPEIRHSNMVNAWKLDPTGLLGINLLPDCFLSEASLKPVDQFLYFKQALLTDESFFADLLAHAPAANNMISIHEQTVYSLLELRGFERFSCRIDYPSVEFDPDVPVNMVETVLSNECDSSRFCFPKRQAFIHTLINAGDYARATRLVNKWNLSDIYGHREIVVETFRDGSSDYSLIQARRLISEGDFSQAAHHLELSRRAGVTNPDWYYMMAIVMGSRNEWEQSYTLITEALDASEHDVRYLTEKAVVLYHLSRHMQSLNLFQHVLTLSPWSVKARSYTGIILYEMSEYDQALTHFEKALYLAPSDPWSWFNVYMCLNAMPSRENDAVAARAALLAQFDYDAIPDAMKERLLLDSDMHQH